MSLDIVILAAGQGTRMRSALPKVLHPVADKPMLGHVIDTARSLQPSSIQVVIGHGADKVRERLNPRLAIDGVLGTMFDGRTLHSREVMDRLVEAWGDTVFHTVIRRTVKFSDSTVAGEPITSYASASSGAEAYRQLAKEVVARCLREDHAV